MSAHEELIKAGSFDEKFKNALRDYYSYGFRHLYEAGKSRNTAEADWRRLSNLLEDYFEWSEEKGKPRFMTCASREMAENPFHRLYRFCRYNLRDPLALFSALFALSPRVNLRDGMESLNLWKEIVKDTSESGTIENRITGLTLNELSGNSLSTAELLCFFPDGQKIFRGENTSLQRKLEEWKDMDLVRECSVRKEGRKKAHHRWELRENYLADVIRAGTAVNPDFAIHFQNALQFFSRTLPFGETGSFLLRRLGNADSGFFRIKHDYFSKSLNDYHRIDLLAAMEKKRFCLLTIRDPFTGMIREIPGLPLEFRESLANGREYVVIYHPFAREAAPVRLEFLESVELLYGNCLAAGPRVITPEEPYIREDLERASEALRKVWGFAAPGDVSRPPESRTVSFSVRMDRAEEPYILRRMARERRIGNIRVGRGEISFSAKVLDAEEMGPWIRTFYGRVIPPEETEGTESFPESFLKKDPERILKAFTGGEEAGEPGEEDLLSKWVLPDGVSYRTQPSVSHHQIFHEFFSVYYAGIADALLAVFRDEKKEYYTAAEIRQIVSAEIRGRRKEAGRRTVTLLCEELTDILTAGDNPFTLAGWVNPAGRFSSEKPKGNAPVRAYRPKFLAEPEFRDKCRAWLDILPLTRAEGRFLRTMLREAKISLFLDEAEVEALKSALPGEWKAFPLERFLLPDRDRVSAKKRQNRQPVIRLLQEAFRADREVSLRYITARGKHISGKFCPVVLEYSRKDDIFRLYAWSGRDDKIYILNTEKIEEITMTENTFSRQSAAEKLRRYRRENECTAEFSFPGEEGLADRLLTEFSPWKKSCVYDPKSGRYRLKIWYEKQDEKEMGIRVLGYGSRIRPEDEKHVLYRENLQKLEKQAEISRYYLDGDLPR